MSDDGEAVNMILGTFIFVWIVSISFRTPLAPRLGGYVSA